MLPLSQNSDTMDATERLDGVSVHKGREMEKLSLREFIEKREAEIKNLMVSLKRELKELRAARDAIMSESTAAKSSEVRDIDSDSPKRTIKEMALISLMDHGGSGTAEEILEWISEGFGKIIERSSLSPQLSRLKADGRLELDAHSMIWKLAQESSGEAEDLI